MTAYEFVVICRTAYATCWYFFFMMPNYEKKIKNKCRFHNTSRSLIKWRFIRFIIVDILFQLFHISYKCSWPDKNEVYVSMIVRKTVFVYQTFLKIFLKFWQDKLTYKCSWPNKNEVYVNTIITNLGKNWLCYQKFLMINFWNFDKNDKH